ncbi:hypothetical protein B4U79_07393 [Dinothrombium tinctorium]|uniref:Peptidase M12A domain-containing protein n=1 Tax=Dinothrombium tinctorium TaxID=1965070 RepID=A0A3S3PPG2_9ACAR|nr:hypothetical protein B4U79_07393 [Dinothrombium tinctorium]
MIASILLLVALVLSYGCSELHSQSSDEIYRKALENPDLYEGDIFYHYQKRKDRFAVSDTSNLWPNGVIPYEISRSLRKF